MKANRAPVTRQQKLLNPLDYYDSLTIIRNRFCGLRSAISGTSIGNDADRAGLLQLAEDLLQNMDDLRANISVEGGLRISSRNSEKKSFSQK